MYVVQYCKKEMPVLCHATWFIRNSHDEE